LCVSLPGTLSALLSLNAPLTGSRFVGTAKNLADFRTHGLSRGNITLPDGDRGLVTSLSVTSAWARLAGVRSRVATVHGF
jgi:hypothetical protein